jgi:hypothetical protein
MAYSERVNNEEAAGVLTRFFLSIFFLCPKGRQSFRGINSSSGELTAEHEVGFGSKVYSIESQSQQFFVSFGLIFFG